MRAEQRVNTIEEEVSVFEVAQQREIHRDAESQNAALDVEAGLGLPLFQPLQQQAPRVIEQDGE